ncbi:hypothetical protein [Herbaspirillum robiniae]|uniref:DUF2846 domain-containing protein n=1 Tax=Herbaspirillum robiniae TaxID=2014887 RepID=A0ABX2LWB1_9BURK|nr:hypothetical protein [Herbaspirillum robiniae]NUU01503.1 hypothetical protein [Herbaspirillum robiniae]
MGKNHPRSLGKCLCVAGLALLASACATPPPDTVACTILQQSGRCAAVPVHGDAHEDEARRQVAAPEGFGYLYVARPYAQQRSVKARVYLDGALVAELGPQSFARLKLRPGLHAVEVAANGVAAARATVDMKAEAYLEYRLAERFFATQSGMSEVDRARAAALLPRLDLVVSRQE